MMEPYTTGGLGGSMLRRRPPQGSFGSSNPDNYDRPERQRQRQRLGLPWSPPGWDAAWERARDREAASQRAAARGARLPERSGEPDCAYYVNFGSCRLGERCKLNHPRDRASLLVGDLVVDRGGRASAWIWKRGAAKLPERPLRPGEPDCDYYLKFGTCRLGEHCNFNHPLDRIYAEDPLQHPAGSGSSSSLPESVAPSRLIAQEDPSLSLQHRADSGSSNSLQEAVLHVDDAGLSPSRPAYDEDEAAEPLLLLEHPADSGSNNQKQEDAVDVGAGISLQPEPSLPLQHPAESGIINPELEVAVDVCADVSLEAHPFLPLQYPADRGRNDSLPEVAVTVDAELSASTSSPRHVVDDDVHGTPDDQIKEQQNRCTKYSKKVLVFAIVTFIDYAVSISSIYTVLTKASMAALFVAICSDLFSLKMKPKWCTLVYVSCFHLVLMTTLIFVSLNKDYAYAVLIVPLMIGAPLLQRKLWPQERQQSTSDDRADEKLDDMFNLAALILNGGSLTIALISIVRRFISGPGNYRTGCAAGFLLFFTVVVGLYLMMVTTVRHAALTLHAKYLHNLFIVLVVGTLITTLGPIWFH